MKKQELLQVNIQGRWLLPITITLFALMILWQGRFALKTLSSQYSIAALLACCVFWACVCWWIVFDNTRYTHFSSRLFHCTYCVPGLLFLISTVIVLDFATTLIHDVFMIMYQDLLSMTCLGILSVAIAMFVMATENPAHTLKNVAVFLTTIAIMCISLEIFSRWFLVDSPLPTTEQAFQKIVASSWKHAATVEKASGVSRIIGLSDSFGTAGGEKNYHYVLEELLQSETRRYEVVNFSVGGYEWAEELHLFQHFGSRYQPDIVLHGVFVGNDFWGDPTLLPLKFRGISLHLKKGMASWLPHNFLLRQWIVNSLTLIRNEQAKQIEENPEKHVGSMSHTEFLRVEQKRLAICLRENRQDAQFWKNAEQLLDQIYEEVVRTGARYIMVIHPDQFQVERQLLDELQTTYTLEPGAYDMEQPQKFLRNYCASRNIPCLDLLPTFRQQGSQGGLYLQDDTHYNVQGNQLAAEEIARFVKNALQ